MPKCSNQQKRLVVLIVIGAGVILSSMYHEVPASGKRGIQTARVGPITSMGNNLALKTKSLAVPNTSRESESAEKGWGRDPFDLPPGVQLRETEEGESLKAIRPRIKKVTAILITDSRKVASINHEPVEVGGLIDGEKVLEIEPDRVILEKSGRKYVIRLEESPIQWTKNEGKEHEE